MIFINTPTNILFFFFFFIDTYKLQCFVSKKKKILKIILKIGMGTIRVLNSLFARNFSREFIFVENVYYRIGHSYNMGVYNMSMQTVLSFKIQKPLIMTL